MCANAIARAFQAGVFTNVVLAETVWNAADCLAFSAIAALFFVLASTICPSAHIALEIIMLTFPRSAAVKAIPLQFVVRAQWHHWFLPAHDQA